MVRYKVQGADKNLYTVYRVPFSFCTEFINAAMFIFFSRIKDC
jgi:hypothetical protein